MYSEPPAVFARPFAVSKWLGYAKTHPSFLPARAGRAKDKSGESSFSAHATSRHQGPESHSHASQEPSPWKVHPTEYKKSSAKKTWQGIEKLAITRQPMPAENPAEAKGPINITGKVVIVRVATRDRAEQRPCGICSWRWGPRGKIPRHRWRTIFRPQHVRCC